MNVGQLRAMLETLDPSYPVCLAIGGAPIEILAIVADDWYIPAEEGGVVYLGPHCVLTATHAIPR